MFACARCFCCRLLDANFTLSPLNLVVALALHLPKFIPGLAPRVIKVAPACAIMISSYEYGKLFFKSYNEKHRDR